MNIVASAADRQRKEQEVQWQRVKQDVLEQQQIVNFYDGTPNYELTLDEFELFALKRLRVLRKIDQLQLMKQRCKPEEIRMRMDTVLTKEGLTHTTTSTSSGINVDEASHYILRMSYCQTEELRRWFLSMECELLRHRLHSSSSHGGMIDLAKSVQRIMKIHPMTMKQKRELETPLKQLFETTTKGLVGTGTDKGTTLTSTFENTDFYCVPFIEALDLISNRDCYLHKGMAYMTHSKLVSILVQRFRTQLSFTLSYMSSSPHNPLVHNNNNNNNNINSSASPTPTTTSSTAEALRLEPFLRNINRCLTNPADNTADGGGMSTNNSITANTLLQYKSNMPLCMRQLQSGLQQDKKLKHWGRLQYGLFLKGSGMTMEDSLLFFQRHYTTVTSEQFNKEYAYNIRHMYGKEGKRASYTPYNCTKIIMGNAPAGGTIGEHHGCPYKHYDVNHLEAVLKEIRITNPADRKAILELKQSHQYQLACMKQFEVQHVKYGSGSSSGNNVDLSMMDNVGNHPNAWFRASIYYQHELMNTKNSSSSSNTNTMSTSSISP